MGRKPLGAPVISEPRALVAFYGAIALCTGSPFGSCLDPAYKSCL